MACRSGCTTKDHSSYAECARGANVRIAATVTSTHRDGFESTKKELRAYREARSAGIQPEGTTMDKIQAAHRATKAMGRPYNANVDPPASLITTKKAAKFVASGGDAA